MSTLLTERNGRCSHRHLCAMTVGHELMQSVSVAGERHGHSLGPVRERRQPAGPLQRHRAGGVGADEGPHHPLCVLDGHHRRALSHAHDVQ